MATSTNREKRRKHIVGNDEDDIEEADHVVEVEADKSGQQSCEGEKVFESNSKNDKKERKNTSQVWKHFTRIGIVDGKEKAKCNHCGKAYVIGSKNIGTSTLLRHLKPGPGSCDKIPNYMDVSEMMIDHAGALRARKIEHRIVREKIAYSIIKHNLPYSFVEYEGIRDLLLYLNPDYKSICRKTVVVDVLNFYLDQKAMLKKKLLLSISRICLTSDCWTAITGEGYLCLTAHFVDERWHLNSKILSFSRMEPPHTGIELAKRAYEILVDWGIEKKVFSITLDNASSNFIMHERLKENLKLSNSLLCQGDYFHIRCCAHILNLIVREGLTVVDHAVKKIRENIRYVRQSDARMIEIKKKVVQVGGIDSSVGLRLDVPTRWNSTQAMLEVAIRYCRAFSSLVLNDSSYVHCPSDEEWVRAETICAFLKPFAVITNLISGSTYPTANKYFPQIAKIELLLRKNLNHDDDLIQEMAKNMLTKFDKYWSDYSVILSLAIVLDPRVKLEGIKYAFTNIDPLTSEEKVENIKSKLYDVFNEYKSVGSTSSSTQVDVNASTSNSHSNVLSGASDTQVGSRSTFFMDDELTDNDVFEDLLIVRCSIEKLIEKSELDYYLEEVTLDSSRISTKFDVLDFWKANSNTSRFPCLSKMACDILSIPITTVASESAFSIGSRVLTKYRSSIIPENVEALICARNWLLGFPWNEDSEAERKETAPVPLFPSSENASVANSN